MMVRNWLKSMDMDQMKDQLADLKDQVQEIRFRKPWTRGGETSPLVYMALGGALVWAVRALYKNRDEVAEFCSTCGAKLKSTWEQSGFRQKADRATGKAQEAMASAANGQEPLY